MDKNPTKRLSILYHRIIGGGSALLILLIAALSVAQYTAFGGPESDLVAHFLPRSAIYLILGIVLSLFLFLVAVGALVDTHFVRPAIALVEHIRREAMQGPAYIPKVPPAWVKWFKLVSDTLPLKTVAANLPGAVLQLVRYSSGRLVVPFVSDGVEDLLGLAPNQITGLGECKMGFIAEEDRPKFVAALDQSARVLAPFDYECYVQTTAGHEKWVRFLLRPRTGEMGETVWDGLVLDATDRHKAEEALRQSEENYRSIFETAANLFTSVDRRGIVVDCNRRVLQVLGYTPGEIIGQSMAKMIHPDYHAKAQDSLAKILKEGALYDREYKMVRKDGTVIDVTVNSAGLKNENGEYVRTICIIEDITARKQTEQALKQYSERLEEMVEDHARALLQAREQLAGQEKLAALSELAAGRGIRRSTGRRANRQLPLRVSASGGQPVGVEGAEA